MKKFLLYLSTLLLFSSISFAQTSESDKQKIKTIMHNTEKMQGEIFQEELLIELSDLNNPKTKIKENIINFMSGSDFFSYIGACDELNIIKVKVNKAYFTNYKDVRAKLTDRNISPTVNLLYGSFADLDKICN